MNINTSQSAILPVWFHLFWFPLTIGFLFAQWVSVLFLSNTWVIWNDNNKDQTFQVNALLDAMGPKAEYVLPSLVLTANEIKVYAIATKRPDDQFVARRNIINFRSSAV